MKLSFAIVVSVVIGTNAFVQNVPFAEMRSITAQSSSTTSLPSYLNSLSASSIKPTAACSRGSYLDALYEAKIAVAKTAADNSSKCMINSYLDDLAAITDEYLDSLATNKDSGDPSVPSSSGTVKHLDARGIAYLKSLGNKEGTDRLEQELERLRTENEMLKRVVGDLTFNFRDLAGLLAEMDDRRLEILQSTGKFEEALGNAAEIFPNDDDLSSYEWLIQR